MIAAGATDAPWPYQRNQVQALGRRSEAADLCRTLLAADTNDPDLLYEVGELLFNLEQFEQAAHCFCRILSIRVNDPAGTVMLARALQKQHKPEDALHYYRRAQRLAPDFAVIHLMAGVVAMQIELLEEARQSFSRALALDPACTAARFCSCMILLRMYANVQELEEARQEYALALDDLVACSPLDTPEAVERAMEGFPLASSFLLPYQGHNDLALQQKLGSWVTAVMEARFPRIGSVTASPLSAGEKLRVGFVSGHFYGHSVWKIITRGWMESLDRSKFLLFAYYTGSVRDSFTDAARSLSDVFVQNADVAAQAEIIARHRPHVLIYPGIGMEPETLQLAALRLAPVQCVSWGHPETTGLPTIDYFLSSELMEPADGEVHYTEQLVRLPNLSISYEPLLPSDDLPSLALPGVGDDAVVFLCCQNLLKYLPQDDDIYPAIATRVKGAKFIFLSNSRRNADILAERFTRAFAGRGLAAADHVVLLPLLNGLDYAALNKRADIYLDSIGWSGGNTTFESLIFDKPIVTLPGKMMRGRHTAAILKMIGCEETVASSKAEYIEIAVRLGNEPCWRSTVSSRLASAKRKAYGDRTCIEGLEKFLSEAYAQAVTRSSSEET